MASKLSKKMWVLFFLVFIGLNSGCSKSISQLGALSGAEGEEGEFDNPFREEELPESGTIGDFSSGDTANFEIVSESRMNDYAMRAVNSPTNFRLNVSLDNFGEGKIGGFIKLAYDENGRRVVARFDAGETRNDVQFNRWFDHNGNEAFHGFFEDEYGAVMLVVDEIVDLGDGGSANIISGSLWYKNHRLGPDVGPNPSNSCLPGFGCPNTRCWFVKDGPYECRAFVINDEIATTSALYPDNGYQMLGTFSGLNREVAFAGN